MSKTKSTYQILYDLIEKSIFIYQVPNVDGTIEKIMWKVCTSYAQNKNKKESWNKTSAS